jgi:hypothetical protein
MKNQETLKTAILITRCFQAKRGIPPSFGLPYVSIQLTCGKRCEDQMQADALTLKLRRATMNENGSKVVYPRAGAQLAFARVATALAVFGIGALSIGALALGAVAINRLAIRSGKIKRLAIDDLEVGRLRVKELIREGAWAGQSGMNKQND